MGFPVIIFLTFSIFLTAILSGIFGMAGGLILMTILLSIMPVTAAMVLHASIQLVSNGWRCFLWRRHIVWHVLPPYGLGMVVGFCLMLTVHYVPDKAVTLIVMGSIPLIAMAAGKFIRLNVTSRTDTFIAAAILTFVQMTAGVVGPLLDLLYVNAPFTRQQIISTKAITQSAMHLVRLTYFGTLIPILTGVSGWPEGLRPEIMPVFLIASIAGTSAAALVVHRMSDKGFKKASRVLIALVSLYCVIKGVSMLP